MSQPSKLFQSFKTSKPPDFSSNRQNWLAKIPLRVLLTVPFVIQLVGAVGLVGYLSYRSGQQSVADLADHLVKETGARVAQKLDSYVQGAQQVNQASVAALESGAIRLDDLDQLHRYLILQHRHYPDITSFHFGNPNGDFRLIHHVEPSEVEAGLTQLQSTDLPFEAGQSDPNLPSRLNLYAIDQKGNLGRFLGSLDNIDVRERPWYRRAVETKQPGWSEPFQIGGSNLLAVNAYAPAYDATQQLQGVFSVNLSFERLDQFLETLSVGETGQVFILEKNGLLLASSAEEPEYLTSRSEPLETSNDAAPANQPGIIQFQRLAASESSNPLIKHAAQQLNFTFSDLNAITSTQKLTFREQGKLHYLCVFPYQDAYGLDWLVVTVVPETDFMAQIHANQRRTIGLCVLTFGLALGTGLLTAHWIAAPIRRLQQAADAIARGQFDTPIPIGGVGEVAQLAEQFQRMAYQLSIFFETAQASEEKFASLLDDLPIGVSVLDASGQRVYTNWVGQQMLGHNLDQGLLTLSFNQLLDRFPVYVAGTQTLYPRDQLPVVRSLQGESVTADDIEIEINGQRIPLEVRTIPIWDEQGQVIYIINVFQDITERRKAAQLQERYQRDLEQALTHQAEAFLQSEARFRFAVDQMPDVFALYDAERRFQFVNAQGIEQSGLTLEDHLGKRDEDLYSPEVTDAYLPLLKTAIATRSIQTGECTITLPDREPLTIIVKYAPLLDSKGNIQQILALTYDITSRKRAEQALQDSEERFRQIAETINQVFMVRDADSGQFLYISPAYESIWGQSCQSLYQDPESWLEAIHPDDLPIVQQSLQQQFSGQRTHREYRIQRSDGTIRWIRAAISTVRDEQGNVVRHVGLAEDITERKQAELALQFTTQQLQTFLNNAPVIISLFDAEGRYLQVNPAFAALLDRSAADIVGQKFTDLHPAAVVDRFHARLKQITESGLPLQVDDEIVLDGEVKTFQSILFPVMDEQGLPSTFWAISTDISDRKRTEQALQESEARLQLITDSLPGCISYIDASQRYQFVNRVYEQWFDLRREDILGCTVEEIIGTDAYQVVRPYLERAQAGETVTFENELSDQPGKPRYLFGVFVPDLDAEGKVRGVYALITDISDRKQFELALQEANARQQAILSGLPDLMFVVDANGLLLEKVTHRPQLDLFVPGAGKIQDSIFCVGSPENIAMKQAAIQQVLTSGTTYVYEQQVERDGKAWYEEVRCVPMLGNRVLFMIRDISDRKQAELLLQETNARQQAILSVMPDLMYVVAIDGTILGQVTFRPKRDLFPVDQSISDVTIFDVGPPEISRRKMLALRTALATRTVQTYEQQVEKDGETWHEEVRCVPMPRDRVLFMFRDISDRKRAEEELKQSEDRFRKAFDNAPIGMALVAPMTGRFLRVNRELQQILGYSEAELLQLSFQEITHVDDLKADLDGRQRLIMGNIRQYQVQKRYIHKQGHIVRVLLSSSVVRDQADDPLYFVTHILDISDRYRIDRMKDEFISIVSHELRTPLTAIRGSLGILESGVLDNEPDQIQAMLKIASNNSERLVRLVNDILDLERLESGKVELLMQKCSVAAVIQDAIGAVSAIADANSITLSVSQVEASLYAAPDAIVQTLTNLLSNAIKFSDPGSTVWLTAGPAAAAMPDVTNPSATYWQFSVRDQGRGIPVDKRDIIFQRFQQIDVSDARQKGGTGLGLTICQTIIRQHGGQIWIESEVGQGSIFCFTIPCWRNEV